MRCSPGTAAPGIRSRHEPRRASAEAIRLLVSDIDGTLVRDDKSLPEANREAILALGGGRSGRPR